MMTAMNIPVYDFEDYVSKHGVPEPQDPLPYQRPRSVFSKNNHDNDNAGTTTSSTSTPKFQLTSAKNDPRLRTVVCRHWLRGLCMKGSACEFLHQYDLSKMPYCQRGDQCQDRECPLKHNGMENVNRKGACVFYSQGFCRHGKYCKYKHCKKNREDLPIVANFQAGIASPIKSSLRHFSAAKKRLEGRNH